MHIVVELNLCECMAHDTGFPDIVFVRIIDIASRLYHYCFHEGRCRRFRCLWAWLLNEYSDHEVHLYEASDRPGGHASTVRFNSENASVDVDTSVHLLIFSRFPFR